MYLVDYMRNGRSGTVGMHLKKDAEILLRWGCGDIDGEGVFEPAGIRIGEDPGSPGLLADTVRIPEVLCCGEPMEPIGTRSQVILGKRIGVAEYTCRGWCQTFLKIETRATDR